MIHHQYNPDYQFVKRPVEFNKYTNRSLLQYCLGATMYMPGTKDFAEAILSKKFAGLTSMVMCFEDACKAEDVPYAEANSISLMNRIHSAIENGEFDYANLPLLFFRVRSVEQFRKFSEKLEPHHINLITGFNFPKFNTENGEAYFCILEELNSKYNEILYGMPIIEDSRVAFK